MFFFVPSFVCSHSFFCPLFVSFYLLYVFRWFMFVDFCVAVCLFWLLLFVLPYHLRRRTLVGPCCSWELRFAGVLCPFVTHEYISGAWHNITAQHNTIQHNTTQHGTTITERRADVLQEEDWKKKEQEQQKNSNKRSIEERGFILTPIIASLTVEGALGAQCQSVPFWMIQMSKSAFTAPEKQWMRRLQGPYCLLFCSLPIGPFFMTNIDMHGHAVAKRRSSCWGVGILRILSASPRNCSVIDLVLATKEEQKQKQQQQQHQQQQNQQQQQQKKQQQQQQNQQQTTTTTSTTTTTT